MRIREHRLGIFLVVGAFFVGQFIFAAPGAGPARARPPKWRDADSNIFFADAREKLAGARPDAASRTAAAAPAAGAVGAAPAAGGTAAAGGAFAWSKLIAPETIEDEIKAQQPKVSDAVSTKPRFMGGGYKEARTEFSVIALMFGIIGEYDGDVRWKSQAAGIRDLMGRAGQNCKVATDASFNESKVRKDDLESLVRGGNIELPNAEAKATWDKVTGRPPLMVRLEQAQQQGVAVYTANAGEFEKHSDALLHEAQVIAAIAEVIQREGYEYADDSTYLGFAVQMRQAAVEVADAVKLKNYDAARKASGNIEKACSSCHEGFRS